MQANVTVGVRVRFGAAHGQVLTEATLVPFSTVGHVRSLTSSIPLSPLAWTCTFSYFLNKNKWRL